MQYNEAFIDQIQSAQSSDKLLDIWRKMSTESFLNWYVKPEQPKDAEADFIAIDNIEKQKHLLVELLDKNQLYVHFSEMDDTKFEVSKKDKSLNREFYR